MRKRLLLPLLMLAAFAFAGTPITVDALIKDAAKHNNKPVVVTGQIETFKQRKSKAGNDYVTLTLKGENESVNVYLRGKFTPVPKKGAHAEVTGVYHKEKKIKDFVIKNEIDASVDPKDDYTKDYGMKILKDE